MCQRMTNAICYMARKDGYTLVNYIDDMVGAAAPGPGATREYVYLCNLVSSLGLKVAESKLCPPSTQMTFIGIEFDTNEQVMRIPPEKLAETLTLLRQWEKRTRATKRQLQSILGKLHHISQCVRPARLFVARMLDTLRVAPDSGMVPLGTEFQKDIQWFLSFLPTHNGISVLHHSQVCTEGFAVELDACLTGIGGIFEFEYYHEQWPAFIIEEKHCSTHLEMLNIVIAMKLWCDKWAGRHIRIKCDNISSVFVLNTGRGRDSFLLKCAREIWLICTMNDISFTAVHFPGICNITADALSRYHSGGRYVEIVKQLQRDSNLTRRYVDARLFRLSSDL